MAKIYGTNVAVFGKSFEIKGLIDRHLEVYETKTKFKLVMFRSTHKGWHKDNNIIDSREIKKPATSADVMTIVNEFGFGTNNLMWKNESFTI